MSISTSMVLKAKRNLRKAGYFPDDTVVSDTEIALVYDDDDMDAVYEAVAVLKEAFPNNHIDLEDDFNGESRIALIIAEDDEKEKEPEKVEVEIDVPEEGFGVVDLDEDKDEEEDLEAAMDFLGESDDDDELDIEIVDEAPDDDDDDDGEGDAPTEGLKLHQEGPAEGLKLHQEGPEEADGPLFEIGDSFESPEEDKELVVRDKDKDSEGKEELTVVEIDEDGDEDEAKTDATALQAFLTDKEYTPVATNVEREIMALAQAVEAEGLLEEAEGIRAYLPETEEAPQENKVVAYQEDKPIAVKPNIEPGTQDYPPDFGGSYGFDVCGALSKYGFRCSETDGSVVAETDSVKLVLKDAETHYGCEVTQKTAAPDSTPTKHPLLKKIRSKQDLESMVEGLGCTKAAVAYLTNLNEVSTGSTDQIDMALYDKGTDDPFWNVTVAGMPVGQIHLEDQTRSKEISHIFVTNKWAEAMKEAMVRMGTSEVLHLHKTRSFVAVADTTETVARLEEEYEGKFSLLRDGLRQAVAAVLPVAIAAINKGVNVLEEDGVESMGDPLKEALFGRLVDLVHDPSSIIEAATQDSMGSYVNQLFDITYRLIDMEHEAYQVISKHIMKFAGSVESDVPIRNASSGQDYSRQLERGNVPVQATTGPISRDSSYRDKIKAALQSRNRMRRGI